MGELGKPLPEGVPNESFARSPTPGRAIQIQRGDKRRMLGRLHQNTKDLCSFAHGSSKANLFRMMLTSVLSCRSNRPLGNTRSLPPGCRSLKAERLSELLPSFGTSSGRHPFWDRFVREDSWTFSLRLNVKSGSSDDSWVSCNISCTEFGLPRKP